MRPRGHPVRARQRGAAPHAVEARADGHGDRRDDRQRAVDLLEQDEDDRAGEGGRRVKRRPVPEDHRDLVDEHVAHDTAARGGDHAHQHGHGRRQAQLERHGDADDAEESEPQRIHKLAAGHEPAREVVHALAVHERDAERKDDDQVLPPAHPEERTPVEQYVANGAATEGRHHGERVRAHEVEVLLGGRDHRRQRGEHDGDDLEDQDGGDTLEHGEREEGGCRVWKGDGGGPAATTLQANAAGLVRQRGACW